jgi:ribosome-binding protein aMBF1 (putative translation factor)
MSISNDPPSDYHQRLASQVRAARLRCAYSVEALAELASVDPSMIVRLEKGDLSEDDASYRKRVLDTLGLGAVARR